MVAVFYGSETCKPTHLELGWLSVEAQSLTSVLCIGHTQMQYTTSTTPGQESQEAIL